MSFAAIVTRTRSTVAMNGNGRMTFRFEGEDAILAEYQDYHQERPMHLLPHSSRRQTKSSSQA